MKRLLLLPLLVAGCFGGPGFSGEPGMMMSMGQRERELPWPRVRIDEPAGARVVMEKGVFGDGVDAKVPLEGQFQPTAAAPRAGYPLEIRLDGAAAHRFGAAKALTIYARLNINQTKQRHGMLVLAPSECLLRALVAGDLDEVKISADVLPTADQVCREHEHVHAPTGDAHDGHAEGACPMHGGGGCPMMHGGGCPMHGGGGCPMMHGGGHDKGCGSPMMHGCGHGMHHGMFNAPPPGATLTLRMTKF